MAIIKGDPGKSTRKGKNERFFEMIKYITLAIGILITSISLLLIVIERINKESKAKKRYDQGAIGEEDVGKLLKGLSDDYTVFHDIKTPFGNIDHIVANKNGKIFLLETKSHRGVVTYDGDKLLVNGRMTEKDFIRQIIKNTLWLKERIKEDTGYDIWINAVIVFTNASVRVGHIDYVNVVDKNLLLQFVKKRAAATDVTMDKYKPTRLLTFFRELQKAGKR